MDHLGKFLLLLLVGLSSIVFSIIIIIYFAKNREARLQPRNHGWLVLVIIFLLQVTTDYPLGMSFFYYGKVWPESYAYCVWWTWYEFSFNGIGLFLMASISIERHVLIFHPQGAFQTPWRKWLFHYIPIIACVAWPPLFYLLIVVISPLCSTEWTYLEFNCGVPCYFTVYFVGQFDFLFNIVAPLGLIIVANVLLVIRVIYQKISRHQPVNWRRQRKMTVQLWTISSLYLAFWLPITIVQLIQLTAIPTFMLDQVTTLLFCIYFVPLLLPMVCLSTLPDLVKKMLRFVGWRRTNTVHGNTISHAPAPTTRRTTRILV